mgnify:CR=1 FL=1
MSTLQAGFAKVKTTPDFPVGMSGYGCDATRLWEKIEEDLYEALNSLGIGILGAGGAGFPTHVKINCKAEYVLANGAECEPLLRVDQQVMQVYAADVVKGIRGESIDSLYTTPKYTMVDKHHYETVVEGMRDAVLNGTCRAADLPGFEVCGKTGTAQNRGKDHSAFMGFAPMHDPKIAVAVYVENGGFGAVYGVPIGALIMEKYLTGTLSEESEKKAKDIQQRVIYYGNQER